jgi:septal ring factor EnvC (AmiA/AmiB activator)
MEDLQKDLDSYEQRYQQLCVNEAQLARKLARLKEEAEGHAEIAEQLRQKSAELSQLSDEQHDDDEDIINGIAHVEQLSMQREDLLSSEMQFIYMEHMVAEEPKPLIQDSVLISSASLIISLALFLIIVWRQRLHHN